MCRQLLFTGGTLAHSETLSILCQSWQGTGRRDVDRKTWGGLAEIQSCKAHVSLSVWKKSVVNCTGISEIFVPAFAAAFSEV